MSTGKEEHGNDLFNYTPNYPDLITSIKASARIGGVHPSTGADHDPVHRISGSNFLLVLRVLGRERPRLSGWKTGLHELR